MRKKRNAKNDEMTTHQIIIDYSSDLFITQGRAGVDFNNLWKRDSNFLV